MTLAPAHIEALIARAGAGGGTTDADTIAPHITEWRDKFMGATPLMLTPKDTESVAAILAYANEHTIRVVPQGGNTGLVGGGIPGLEGREEILLSLKKMDRILSVEPESYLLTAEAGATIASVQAAAAAKDRLFPLSLASEGSCTVGGTISTNAGGVHVIRYGTMRRLVAGVEAVLPAGTIIRDLDGLPKNNTGYDLKQLLIGAEGTLGIVTRATLRLAEPERVRHTLWLAVPSPAAALTALSTLKDVTGGRVSAAEIVSAAGLGLVLAHIPGARDPLSSPSPWYLLIEAATTGEDAALETAIMTWLEARMADGTVTDGTLAQSLTEREALWKLRESLSEAQKHEGASIKHDIAVPVTSVPAFLKDGTALIEARWPGARVIAFGHVGDGNIHFNVSVPKGGDGKVFLKEWEAMNAAVHDLVVSMGGSISAEHGIGTLKRGELGRLKPAAELEAMRAIKRALDPKGILNPGVLIPY
ncbi:FAD-binding oxidoreductase [Gimibacter soli]|uniref:FAD-binding oxidoreductase n=1 Tax=Gimibacter soli TaxID=3024400 RepID=A0AAE9XTZ3_9PROT|nr:FAD-binding oxidoreductase [Gimibacter soli]WCL52629.1 FAD-binding oxidoreductase [Gimibacter soli]